MLPEFAMEVPWVVGCRVGAPGYMAGTGVVHPCCKWLIFESGKTGFITFLVAEHGIS